MFKNFLKHPITFIFILFIALSWFSLHLVSLSDDRRPRNVKTIENNYVKKEDLNEIYRDVQTFNLEILGIVVTIILAIAGYNIWSSEKYKKELKELQNYIELKKVEEEKYMRYQNYLYKKGEYEGGFNSIKFLEWSVNNPDEYGYAEEYIANSAENIFKKIIEFLKCYIEIYEEEFDFVVKDNFFFVKNLLKKILGSDRHKKYLKQEYVDEFEIISQELVDLRLIPGSFMKIFEEYRKPNKEPEEDK